MWKPNCQSDSEINGCVNKTKNKDKFHVLAEEKSNIINEFK